MGILILVVEDDENSLCLQETMLQGRGYDVVAATNGIEALRQLEQNEPQLIISDILMPEMDGYELCRQCKADSRLSKIPFVFYSATYTEPQDKQHALDLGASKFFVKPMEVEQFLKEIDAVLAEYRTDALSTPKGSGKANAELNRDYSKILGRKLDKKVQEVKNVRRQAELSEEKYRRLVEQAPIGIMRTNMKGTIETVNSHMAAMLGYDSPRAMLEQVKDLASDVYLNPEDRQGVLEKLREYGEVLNLECVFKRVDSGEVLVSMCARVVRDGLGNEEFYEVFISDVTEKRRSEEALRQSEERFDMALRAVSDGLWDLNLKTREMFFSPRYYEMLGYAPNEFPASHEGWVELLHPEDRDRAEAVINDYIFSIERGYGGTGPVSSEFRMRTKEGGWKWILGRGRIVAWDEQGEPVRMLGTIVDLTERKRTEEFIIQSEKMMSVGGLAAGMAHEINNTLAAVIGFSQTIGNRLSKDMAKNRKAAEKSGISFDALQDYLAERDIPMMLDRILNAGKLAANIAGNMLNFSRKSGGRRALHNLEDLFERTLELAAHDLGQTGSRFCREVRIVREYDKNLVPVVCEGNEIQQVLLNLLKNGFEAMSEKEYGEDEPRIILRLKRKGDMAVVEVEDNGPGMDVETGKHIFEPFFTTKGEGKGTGLGLSVSHFLITDHHAGNMEVESAPGEWTRFTISLPIAGRDDDLADDGV